MITEQRSNQRITVKLEVYWHTGSGQQLVQITNLSLGGCFIKALIQPPLETPISLELRLPTGQWINLEGIVVRCQEGKGFGVRFASQEIAALSELLNRVLKR